MAAAEESTVAVLGATGAQGGGVVSSLQAHGGFRVRALTRSPDGARGLGDEVRAADLTRPATLHAAFEGAYGVFANTNSFAGPDVDEVAQGRAIVEAAKDAGVRHFVWSTLPNVAEISGGHFDVPHFTNKALVNSIARSAGFDWLTFVEPPFYFQNLTSPMYQARPGSDGTPTWSQPMTATSRTIHMGDIRELGNLVTGALATPEAAGQGQHLSLAGDLMSWNDVIATLVAQGHEIAFEQAPDDVWDDSFPGASAIRHMFNYMEAYTYFGPDAASKIAAANAVTAEPFTSFADWAASNIT